MSALDCLLDMDRNCGPGVTSRSCDSCFKWGSKIAGSTQREPLEVSGVGELQIASVLLARQICTYA